uniref:Uncharacterized protein n=1 Tax=Pavo cristatus TaxID=9049 RepID=A0A8C9FJE3_PAVCR
MWNPSLTLAPLSRREGKEPGAGARALRLETRPEIFPQGCCLLPGRTGPGLPGLPAPWQRRSAEPAPTAPARPAPRTAPAPAPQPRSLKVGPD